MRLDALTVLGASIDGAHGALLLGKSERSGITHAFDVDLSSASPRVKRRDADGHAVEALGAQDAACVAKLLRAVGDGDARAPAAARTMTEATLEGRPLGQCDPGGGVRAARVARRPRRARDRAPRRGHRASSFSGATSTPVTATRCS